MRLVLSHPELMQRTCDECQKWIYEDNGQQLSTRKHLDRKGNPMRRPLGTSPPCWKCPKAKNEQPNPDAELSEKNWKALSFYYEIKAGFPMPNDVTVRFNCGLIRWVEDELARVRMLAQQELFLNLLPLAVAKR